MTVNPEIWSEIDLVFKGIPAQALLARAADARAALTANPELVRLKKGGELVTQADIEIQEQLLCYFAGSALAGTYCVRAEEQLDAGCPAADARAVKWQLIVDPLDGTGAFCRGEPFWGVMAGLCDRSGALVYSWNLLSSGG
jgi:fructose-1,6-bisphosphatase/inositol monophosphatase family enzyme